MKREYLVWAVIPVLLAASGCINPTETKRDIEFEFCWDALSMMFIFQDRLPADPYVYDTPARLYESVNDPYTKYLLHDQAVSLMTSMTTENGGIGILVDSVGTGYAILVVIPNSPGEAAGLLEGDTIVAADGNLLAGLALSEAREYLRGEIGEEKTLSIKRADDTLDIIVILGTYYAPSVYTDSLDSVTAYIALIMFSETTVHPQGSAGEMGDALDETAWAEYTILDLRDNGGGLLSQCVDITSEFVPEGTEIILVSDRVPVTNYYAVTQDTILTAAGGGKALDRKLYVLVNGNTASAAEILLSCLQDQRASTLTVGTVTYGKGSGWRYYWTPEDAMVTVTSVLLTPIIGEGYNLVGITPDIVIDSLGEAQQVAMDEIAGGGIGKRRDMVLGGVSRINSIRAQLLPKVWQPLLVLPPLE